MEITIPPDMQIVGIIAALIIIGFGVGWLVLIAMKRGS